MTYSRQYFLPKTAIWRFLAISSRIRPKYSISIVFGLQFYINMPVGMPKKHSQIDLRFFGDFWLFLPGYDPNIPFPLCSVFNFTLICQLVCPKSIPRSIYDFLAIFGDFFGDTVKIPPPSCSAFNVSLEYIVFRAKMEKCLTIN